MIQRFDHRDSRDSRRILRFPAIQPCEGVSKDVLIASLINLGRSICDHKSKKFTTQRRNAREAIRVIGVLIIFFEEIRDAQSQSQSHAQSQSESESQSQSQSQSNMCDSVLLCLLEIHVAFQKIWYLLDDCSREGARLWILMKHNRVATEFRVLIRMLATALDVIPMDSIDAGEEVKEFVRLVAKQSQRRKFEGEFGDERACCDVVLILNQFENRVSPNLGDLKRVLDYLGIGSWSDCNWEIKFLNEEIELESSSDKDREREVSLLKSLAALMSYCRVVVFDEIDSSSSNQRIEILDNGEEFLRFVNPEDFKCPITLEIMTDPVTISTGQTYDRDSIHKWFKSGNLTCPKTGEKLMNTKSVPNSSLKSLICRYCFLNNGAQITKQSKCRSRDIVRTVSAGTPAAAESIRMLSEFLADKLANGCGSDRNKSAHEIRLLAKSNIFYRSTLVNANTVPYLLNLLCSLDPSTQDNAMAALLNLSKHPKSKSIVVENGGLVLILDVLREGLKVESKQNAAATLFYLSSVQDYRELIGETPGAIAALVDLIGESGTPRGKKNALATIFGLVLSPSNQGRVVRAGAVPLLIGIVESSSRSDLKTDSLAVLAVLAESEEGALAIRNVGCGLRVLVEVLECECSSLAEEYSVSALLSLCRNEGGSDEVVSVLNKCESLMGALYAVVAGGNSKARKKASALISVLHGFHNQRRSCGLQS